MRLVNEEVIERMAQRVRENPEKMKLRKEIVEHPFGTIKRWMGQGYFLMKGIKKVAAEISLTVLGYNIKRVINIVGVEKMIEAVCVICNSLKIIDPLRANTNAEDIIKSRLFNLAGLRMVKNL